MIDLESPFPVQPCYSDQRGDGFAASRDLFPNELILRVAPVAAVPKDSHITSVCAFCFRRGGTGPAAAAHREVKVVRSSRHAHGGGGYNGKGCGRHAADGRGGGGESGRHDAHDGGMRHVDLLLCVKCYAASFCARCRASAWVVAKHAEECPALGALIGMRRTRTEAAVCRRPQSGEETVRPGPSRSSTNNNTAPPPSSSTAAASAASYTAAAAATRGEDTTTLRLVLSLACFVARARRKARRSSRCDTTTLGIPSRSLRPALMMGDTLLGM